MSWPTREISQVCSHVVDCVNRTAPVVDYVTPYKMLRTTNVKGGFVDTENVRYVTLETYERWTRRLVPERGDVFLTREAPLGDVGRLTSDDNVFLGQRLFHYRADPELIDARFLAYALQSPKVQGWIKGLGMGATVEHARVGDFHKIPIPMPPLAVQTRIGVTLSAYDDLIENNRRRIALLEEAARMLYREWFVHFRFPGHEHVKVIDDLPEGWERRALGEIAEVRLGMMLDGKKNRGDLRPYLANVNVRWGRFDLSELRTMRFETREIQKYGLMHGDIVMCEGGEPGRSAIWKDQVPGMMLQKALHRIRSRDGGLDHQFIYYCLSFMARSGRLAGLFTGATIKHLPREKLITVRVEIPPERLVREFSDYVAPIEAQIRTLEAAVSRASEARNLLLPRLMNGEIPV